MEQNGRGPTPPAGRKWVWILCIVAIIVVGALAFQRHRQSAGATSQPSQADAKNRSVPVTVTPVRQADFPVYLDGLGSATALNTVTVKSRVDGQITKVAFVEGQSVKAGDLLVQIDPRPYQVQLDEAQAQLLKDQSAAKNAQIELDRDKQAADAIPKQTIDTQQATTDQANASVKLDEATIESAQLQLTYSHVTAPISGRIGLRLVDEGNIVHATDTTGVAIIVQVEPIDVIFSLAQDDLVPVIQRPDRGVGLTVEAYDREFTTQLAEGKIAAIDNQVDASTGTVRVKAEFSNEKDTLFPNQFVNARLLVKTLHNAIVAPSAAVQRGPDFMFVYVLKPDQTVEVRKITAGATEGDQIVIETGLAADEQVVTDGIDKLRNGSKVQVRRPGGAATRSATSQPGSTTRPHGNRHRTDSTGDDTSGNGGGETHNGGEGGTKTGGGE